MNLHVDIQNASTEPAPDEDDIRAWLRAVLAAASDRSEAEVSLRLVDEPEMSRLNQRYRGKDGPTNVLSFPAELPPGPDLPLLGDIVVCTPVVRREANEQGKALDAHWAHMLVHGALHLLGYDHVEQDQAETMEALETDILAGLDYPCPYAAGERTAR